MEPTNPPVLDRPDYLAVTVDVFATALGAQPETLDVHAPLQQLPNMQSVTFLRAIALLEDRTGVVVPDELLYEAGSLAEVASVFGSQPR